MAVIASATGAAVFGLGAGTLAAGLAGGALLGAGAGALYSGITGKGDILNSALTGALIGGSVGGLGASFGPGLMSQFGAGTAVSSTTPALTAAQMGAMTPAQVAALTPAQLNAAAAAQGVLAEGAAALPGMGLSAAPNVITPQIMAATGAQPVPTMGLTGKEKLGYGLAATTALSALSPKSKLNAPPPSPSYIRPYTYSSTPNLAGNEYPSPYPSTPLYDAQGNPNLDTRERDYFTQTFTAGEPYRAAQGGLMASYQQGGPVERMSQMNAAINPQGGLYPQGMIDKTQYALPTQRPTSMEVLDAGAQRMYAAGGQAKGYDAGGDVEMDEKRRKAIMKNIKGASTEQLEKIIGSMNEQEFLMKNMPNYAQAMSPSISGMIEGAQYGDRMTRAYEDIAKKRAMEMGEKFVPQENYARIQPTMVNPQSGTYGGIASIGRQIDPQTRINAMANIQRTPYDRNVMESVRRLGVGVDRQLGKDTNLSAFYEQDPKGREKMGGVRLSQRFSEGGMSDLGGYSDGGRLLKGPGDGVSDDIPAMIGDRQPARLADGEFVIPARIVSELGNGSTDAGAKRLYAMMDKIQAGRKKTVGKNKVAVDSKANKHLLA